MLHVLLVAVEYLFFGSSLSNKGVAYFKLTKLSCFLFYSFKLAEVAGFFTFHFDGSMRMSLSQEVDDGILNIYA